MSQSIVSGKNSATINSLSMPTKINVLLFFVKTILEFKSKLVLSTFLSCFRNTFEMLSKTHSRIIDTLQYNFRIIRKITNYIV